ncbi:hemerythrin domain-containing protein [Streptomyces sp. NPDC093260]|uniref:hemerythrin domain-containing protein n=1 Tax=Streptomyces sp. NPDC093260 TaxID=3155073 RepID=UPI00341830BC
MTSRSQVRRLLADGLGYEEAGRRLGVPAGKAFLIATGLPADGGGTPTTAERHRPGMPGRSTQHLAGPPAVNPTSDDTTRHWLRRRAVADVQMRRAARGHGVGPQGERAPDGVRDLTDVLTHDHDRLTALVKQLQTLPGTRQGATEAQRRRRRAVVDALAEALASHVPAERRWLWPLVRETLGGGDRLADRALEQDDEGADALAELRRTPPDGEDFDALAERVGGQVRRHVAFADAVFARLRQTVPQDVRERLGAEVVRAWRDGPPPPGAQEAPP